jgi:hypothetical protein
VRPRVAPPTAAVGVSSNPARTAFSFRGKPGPRSDRSRRADRRRLGRSRSWRGPGTPVAFSRDSRSMPSRTSTDKRAIPLSPPRPAAPRPPAPAREHGLIIDRLSDRYVALHGGSSFDLAGSPARLPPGAERAGGTAVTSKFYEPRDNLEDRVSSKRIGDGGDGEAGRRGGWLIGLARHGSRNFLAVARAAIAVGTPGDPVALSRASLRVASRRVSRGALRWPGRLRSCSRRGLACSSGSQHRDRSAA